MLKVLLLQIRNPHDPMRDHEVECFAARCALEREDLVAVDVVHHAPSLAEVRAHDALMIGGSGEYYVSKQNQPGLAALHTLLRDVVDAGHPTFAACYGFQCLMSALGGEVVHAPERAEVGTFALTVTEAGRRDPLFSALPPTFMAQQGHKDHVTRMPEGLETLAASPRSPHQATRIPGLPIWAVQFHPELDQHANRHRYEHYLDLYSAHMSAEERLAALEGFHPSPHASALLGAFLEQL